MKLGSAAKDRLPQAPATDGGW